MAWLATSAVRIGFAMPGCAVRQTSVMSRAAALALVAYVVALASLATPLYEPLSDGRDDSWALAVLLAATHLGMGMAVRRWWVLLLPAGAGLAAFAFNGAGGLAWLILGAGGAGAGPRDGPGMAARPRAAPPRRAGRRGGVLRAPHVSRGLGGVGDRAA